MGDQIATSVRIVDECGNPWSVDIGAKYLLDLRAVLYTGFRVSWSDGLEKAGRGGLVQHVDSTLGSTCILPFSALPREPDRVVPWESNLVYSSGDRANLREVVVPSSAVVFGAPERTLRSDENQLIQVDLITFHSSRGEPIRLPDNVRRTYAEQMWSVNGYRNCAQAAEDLERYGVDRTIEEGLLEGWDAVCATAHVVAPFLIEGSDAMERRSIALPGPSTGGEAILRLVLTSDLEAVSSHMSDFYEELERDDPDPNAVEELDGSMMGLIWERFVWADSSEEFIEDELSKSSPLEPAGGQLP